MSTLRFASSARAQRAAKSREDGPRESLPTPRALALHAVVVTLALGPRPSRSLALAPALALAAWGDA